MMCRCPARACKGSRLVEKSLGEDEGGGGGTGEMGINGDVHWVEYDFPGILLSRVISGVSLRDCFESTTAKCLTVNPCHA